MYTVCGNHYENKYRKKKKEKKTMHALILKLKKVSTCFSILIKKQTPSKNCIILQKKQRLSFIIWSNAASVTHLQ